MLILSDTAALLASLWLGYELRFDFSIPLSIRETFPVTFPLAIGLQLLSLWRFRQFEVLLGHFSPSESSRLFSSLFVPMLIIFGLSHQLGSNFAPPRSVVLTDFGFAVIALTAIRLAFRPAEPRIASNRRRPRRRARRAGIIGAGLVGEALAREFARRRDLGLQAVVFFDDDRMKWGKRVHDIPIVGAPEALLNGKGDLELEEVVIAMPSAPASRVAEIAKILRQLQIKFSTVPSIYELTTGQAQVGQLRSVETKDLLGREQVQLGNEDLRHCLQGRVVMVTGAGGSIGSELCRQIAAHAPRQLLLLDQSEVQLFQIEQQLSEAGFHNLIRPLVANVLDRPRLEQIFEQFEPQVVFHAAAHKHVPMMELQPGEAIKNNAFGTLQLAHVSLQFKVERFVLISTDKAINPTNVMGATKRLAEICVQSLYASHPNDTRFMAVRFGNVLGSSGSVVPTFTKQIAAGGPVTVTHPDVTRYFMTIPEAVGLVLQSAAQGRGGEIFLLDMGKPVRILDLARQLIELSGRVPDQDIKIEFTGLRPGEKLFEELCYKGENVTPTCHPKINRLVCDAAPLEQVRGLMDDLVWQADLLEPDQLKRLLKWAVPEYQPQYTKPSPPKPPSLAIQPESDPLTVGIEALAGTLTSKSLQAIALTRQRPALRPRNAA
ncbi:MAG: capsule biosynthesis protein CapD [Verrucomicrobia bacterium]|nr:MAG: capsule biosynthesis protein CapD [Verrucomicrobiota bacterium]